MGCILLNRCLYNKLLRNFDFLALSKIHSGTAEDALAQTDRRDNFGYTLNPASIGL